MIAFIDFEASSLFNGYPIEMGWARSDGRVGAALIRPHPDWRKLDWAADAERIHRLQFSDLDAGIDREEAYALICADLGGCHCFSDAPDFDWKWLSMLSPNESHSLKLGKLPADSILIGIAEQSGIKTPLAVRIIERAKRFGNHTAAGDAASLAAAHEVLGRGGELQMRDVEKTFRQWKTLAVQAAPWRDTRSHEYF